ncbi:MAG: amino acid adenylation domain-containing protein [Nocardioidaceae bacterium]
MTEATLLDVLFSAARRTPDQLIVQVAGDGSERVRTYRQLVDDSLLVAGGLRVANLPVGSPVILLPGGSDDFLPSFWGALAAGLVPVPLAPLPDKVLGVWAHLRRPPIVVTDMFEPLVRRSFVAAGNPGTLRLLTLAKLRDGAPTTTVHQPAPTDLAFLQFSSGSTGAPKGVELTHANVVANIAQARTAGAAAASDVIVSWLPYFHDMGLIGAHLTPLSVGIKQVKLEPLDFGKRPALWYETAARHRATLLPMASFALALTLKRVSSEQVAALDLSSVRLVGVGAEPIPVQVWRQFLAHMRSAGLDPSALMPLYGLAEATLAVTFPPVGEVAQPLTLDRTALSEGRAVDVTPTADGAGPAEFLDVGFAVPGGELRIVGDDGEALADSVVGHIEFSGPNVARRYHARPDETAKTFVDGWLRTGDIGFLRNNRLCITGRAKDVLFINGQKYQAHDVEQIVATTPGVPAGRVAVIGCTDAVCGAERVAVFVSSRESRVSELAEVLTAVRARVREALAYDDVRVLPIPPNDFPRTTSGKLQRAELRKLFAAGAFASLEAQIAQVYAAAAALSSRPPQPPRHAMEAQIIDIWSQVLGVPAGAIHRQDRFLAIGGSSLAAMHVLGMLEDTFGGPLEPAVLRDCTTVAALAEHLLGRPDSPGGNLPVTVPRQQSDDAAIIALACRFPDADTPDAFWDNLVSGRDSVTEVPASRWDTPPGARARWGAFLDDVAGFDADYFGVGADEAAVMDPHARIFLEVAHEALERAGYAGERRNGRRIGVFVAVGESGYAQLLHRAIDSGVPVSPAALVGNLRNLIAARVAHCLNLSGPVMAVDTACSSSLVALHLARRSLDAGECDIALVGGVSLNLTSTPYQLLEAAQALSPTGRCRAFGAGADGFVPGEGAAAIVVEPLAVAHAFGDHVLAVVRGSAVNNDGRSLSLMAPNPLLQEAVIADAYREAGIDAATVSYVEAHGTGTSIGDPIEARSLLRTFPAVTAAEPRWLGSVKTNVGHLLNAAGMPSLLKVVLSLHHRQLPATLHYAKPSAEFDLASAGFEVVTELRDWTAAGHPLRAGINGFGFGGTNVHVILEEAPRDSRAAEVPMSTAGPHLLTLSAASEGALRSSVADLAAYAQTHPDVDEGDLCVSASTARDDGRYRLALVTRGDLATQLETVVAQKGVHPLARPRPRVALLFTGQGSQTSGMGRALHESQPDYRQMLEDLSAAAGLIEGRSLVQWSLDVDVDPVDLAQTAVAQPLLVAFGISLAHQLRAWGVQSDAVLGHSVGELAAAAVSGALSPAEAVCFAVQRGRVMQEHCAPGGMAAVLGAEADVLSVIASAAGELSMAAVNGPDHFVISGTGAAIDAAVTTLSERGCRGRRLRVTHAFHSAMMTPALDSLRTAAANVAPKPQQTPLLSTVTGTWTPTFDASYLAAHARQPVLFGQSVQRLLDEGYDTFLEVGPDATLSGLVRSVVRACSDDQDIGTFSAVEGLAHDGSALIRTVGRLWARGVSISRPAASTRRPRVEVPTYPFQRQRYWLPDVVDRPTGAGSVPLPVSSLLHRFAWGEEPLPAGAVLRSVCIVGSDPRLARELADRLARRAVGVHIAPPGKIDESPPASAVILLPGPAVDIEDVESLDDLARDASTNMLEVSRHLENRPTPLIVVTEDVALTDTAVERTRPGHAIVAGLAMALPEENALQAVRIVDLSSLDDESARLDGLIRELDAPPTPGPAQAVAWRHGRRLTKAPLLNVPLDQDRSTTLPVDGCYLITGGAGGIGAEVARSLAGRGEPEIFLAGRSAACRRTLLDELEQLGARAHYVTADLSVESDVDALVASLPRPDGIFHAAGLIGLGKLQSTTVPGIEEVLAPKVRGTYLLSRALDRRGRRPDTFVVFSSIASALASYAGGLGAYVAANAFLDAFALAETQAGRPVQVLNFAAWADTGMAATPAFRAAAAAKGVPQLSAEQALQALHDATTLSAGQLLVMDVSRQSGLVDATGDAGPTTRALTPPRERIRTADTPVRDVVASLIAAELGQTAEDIDDDASFLAMGLDSLTAVDLVKKLELELGRALPTTLLFEYSSIAALSAYLSTTPAREQSAKVAAQHDDESSFALTPVQVAFHTTGNLHPDIGAYAYLRQSIVGQLHEELLAQSLVFLERRHPMLRMRIPSDGGQPRQVIQPPIETDWPDWFATSDLDAPIEAIEDELCNRVFQLACESPIRAVLLREGAGRASLLIAVHHAAADGASLNVLCQELWQVYTAMCQARSPELLPLQAGFRDYVGLVEELRASETFAADCRYWRERLEADGQAQSRSLPYDGDPGAQPSPPLAARQFLIDGSLSTRLQARAAELDVSLFHLVLTAYVRRLACWGGQQRVTVNVARVGREARLHDIARLVGPFADTLPVTVTVHETSDSAALSHEVRVAWLDSERHASVTTLDLARLLPTVDTTPRTAGSASFSFARFPLVPQPGCPVSITATAARAASAATQLGLVGWEFDGALHFSWNYPATLFSPETIQRFTDEYLAELTAMAGCVATPAVERSVAQRIRAQCRRTPAAVAVQAGDVTLTYAQLDQSAHLLAERLRRLGITTNGRVALLTSPGADTVVGLLGVLHAGAAWVPLDPAHPLRRLAGQVARAGVTAVVCDASTREVAECLGGLGVIDLDVPSADDPLVDGTGPVVGPQDVAYIIFTSGTTGEPKGVPITHSAMTTYLDWAISTFGYHAADRMTATAPICFDASVRQLLAPLLVGATIVAISRDMLRDPHALLATVERRRVTVWSSVPTLWGQLLGAAERRRARTGVTPDLSAVRWIHVGGESLSPAHVRRWFDLFGPGHRIVNLYGPTEATINATYDVIDSRPDDEVTRLPIGRPVGHTAIDVVGPTGESCRPGEPGELQLAGPALTPGYLGEPGLSARAFVERGGARYYRTGDRVVLRPDAKLEFLGRIDQQVKIRGHRVEPGEIEIALMSHSSVERATVVAQPVDGPHLMRLVAYVQPRQSVRPGEPPGGIQDLRAHLASCVPDYMIPAELRLADDMPQCHSTSTGRLGTPPATTTEKLLAAVWSNLLGIDPVFREDDFFALGGDSIAVLEVFSRLETHVPALPPPTAMYRHRTLSALAGAIDVPRSVPAAGTGQPADDVGPFALTPAQRGFLLAEALSPGATTSWLACFRLAGPLDTGLVQQAIDLLVDRHLMLRVVIAADQRPPLQQEVPTPAKLTVSCDVIEPAELHQRIADEREHRFDCSSWPLMRLQLLRLAPEEHAVVVHAHHLIGDGYSVVLLGQDLMALYDGLASGQPAALPQLRSTFRDYAELVLGNSTASQTSPAGEAGADRELYTAPQIRRTDTARVTVGGASTTADFTVDRGTTSDFTVDRGTTSAFTVDRGTTSALRRLAASEGATAYAPLLTSYYRALSRLTGQHDLLLGVAITGRDFSLPDISRMVGPLATVLPVRVRNAGPTFRAQLRHITDTVTAARASGATMQQVASRSPSSTPGPPSFGAQFLFSFLDFDSLGPIVGETVSLTWDDVGTDLELPPLGTDLLFSVRPVDGGLHVTLRACAAVMSPLELRDFAEDLRRELAQIAGSSAREPSITTARSGVLDAALIGYLPAPRDLAPLAGIPASDGLREVIRAGLFPDGRARLLEELSTPLGRSGFVCLPTFADELSARSSDALARDTAQAVDFATGLGARCVSLAGMIPAHTAYGFAVVRALGSHTARVTTGHAATAASVVKTTLAAMAGSRHAISELTVASVGLGSIGRSSLELLLALGVGSPKGLVLCDMASRSPHLTEFATELRAQGYAGEITVCGSDASLSARVYECDVLIAATSADRPILDIDRLRPGTIVVDDSFPHCFDVDAAIRRMQRQGDVLVVGGGLLRCGPSEHRPADDLVMLADTKRLVSFRLRDTIASCQIESLLQADRPDLPVVHGLVDVPLALAYWEALAVGGVEAAPLHLHQHVVTPESLLTFSRF